MGTSPVYIDPAQEPGTKLKIIEGQYRRTSMLGQYPPKLQDTIANSPEFEYPVLPELKEFNKMGKVK